MPKLRVSPKITHRLDVSLQISKLKEFYSKNAQKTPRFWNYFRGGPDVRRFLEKQTNMAHMSFLSFLIQVMRKTILQNSLKLDPLIFGPEC